MENILQNCSGASRASSSQHHTCSALHRRSQGVQQEIQNKLPLTHRVGQLDATDSEKGHPIHVRSLCCSRARPTESATGSRQCNSLQCSLVHGSGRLDPTPLTKQDRRARGTRQQDSQDKQINKRIQGQTNLQMRREGGSHCGGCVCDVGAGGPLQSLVTLVSWHQAQPTKPTSIREEQTKNTRQEQNQQPQQEAKQKGQQTTHQNTHRQRSGQRKPKNEQGRRGRQQAEASSSRTKRAPGKTARTGGRKQHRQKRSAHAALVAF